MAMNKLSKLIRRRFLLSTSMFAAGLELSGTDAALTQELPPTPACHDGDEPTVRQGEGPFFKPRSPERGDLREPGTGGRPFELSGFVLARSCRPLRGALVDLWHADDKGEYDNSGFRYRGHVTTGLDGASDSAPSYRRSTPAVRGTITSRFRHRIAACSPLNSISPTSQQTYGTACFGGNC